MGQYLDTGGTPLHWVDYGGDRSGPLLVLVHGLGGSIPNWDFVGARLTSHGRVLAFDLPGFGLSPPDADWKLQTQVSAITRFVRSQGDSAILIGNSLGGLLCEMAAAQYPDLVDALVLIAPATPPRIPDPNIDWPSAMRLLISSTPVLGPAVVRSVMRSTTPEDLVHESLRRIAHKPGRVPMEVVDALVETAELRRGYPWAADAIPKTGRWIRRYFTRRSDFVAMIREIKAPTLVVQGMEDPIVSPTSVEWLCSLRPDWELTQMEDTGHVPQLDAPMRLLAIIEPWLKEHAGVSGPG